MSQLQTINLTFAIVVIFLLSSEIQCSCDRNPNKFIDLTYAFNNETVTFPGRKITFHTEVEGYTKEGIWLASRAFCTSEHTGTHIDSPYHFNKNGKTLDQLPIEDMIDVPGVLIDIYDKVHHFENGQLSVMENYVLKQEDILEWEEKNGQIPFGAIVLLRTGWGSRWPNVREFRGEKLQVTDAPDNAVNGDTDLKLGGLDLNSPGFDSASARFLAVERQVVGVGIDTISIDPGNTKVYPAHSIFASRSVWMLEMVAHLHLLPAKGFNLWVVPFKIDKGTGAPTRVLARLNC